jgi:ceramide glucosyltransferase
VLKPLHGEEPGLENALASFVRQNHPTKHLTFGMSDPSQPALAVVQRLCVRFPDVDVAIVASPSGHLPIPKISDPIDILPIARHDVLVISEYFSPSRIPGTDGGGVGRVGNRIADVALHRARTA